MDSDSLTAEVRPEGWWWTYWSDRAVTAEKESSLLRQSIEVVRRNAETVKRNLRAEIELSSDAWKRRDNDYKAVSERWLKCWKECMALRQFLEAQGFEILKGDFVRRDGSHSPVYVQRKGK